MTFAILADCRVKLKESEKRDKYLDLARELKKTMEHKSDSSTNCNWHARYSHQRIGIETEGTETECIETEGSGTEGVGNKRMSGDYQNYRIVEIS